jgi:hypothetical protein
MAARTHRSFDFQYNDYDNKYINPNNKRGLSLDDTALYRNFNERAALFDKLRKSLRDNEIATSEISKSKVPVPVPGSMLLSPNMLLYREKSIGRKMKLPYLLKNKDH